MECPECNDVNAYVGSIVIECPNKNCRHYNEKQYKRVLEEKMKSQQSDPDITPIYPWGIDISGAGGFYD